jgi:hypothetical protein
MQEQDLLAIEPGQQRKTVRREIGPSKQRKRVVDISIALLSPETGPTGPTGPLSANSHKNNDDFPNLPDRFPLWYPQNRSRDSPKTSPEISADASPAPGTYPRTDAGAGLWTGFETQPVQKLEPQRLTNQSSGPNGPVGPEKPHMMSTIENRNAHASFEMSEDGEWEEGVV